MEEAPIHFVHPGSTSSMSTVYRCGNCDAQCPKWAGRCSECGKWGTLEKESAAEAETPKAQRREALATVRAAHTTAFTQISADTVARLSTGITECDRVFGGGIVPGAVMLLGGDPGIGKSTLVAQIAGRLGRDVLYVSGEESAAQLKLRLDRLQIDQSHLQFLGEEHVEVICKTVLDMKPALVVIDSIQTVASSAVDGEPGSVNQIRASTVRFLETAKESNVPMLLIGHVTKGGELGGPKTLEHIVDVVLYLEGDRQQQFRLLRAVKNRFGSTNEVGVFEMHETGLQEVANPSERFLHDRSYHAGTCVTAVLEGSRVFLIEVQALVNKTTFGFPQRKASGFDLNRLQLLLAVLDRRAHIAFDTSDVYINIVGGGRIAEPAMDLAVCVALVSALRDVAIPRECVVWGEVGLGGEVRAVSRERDRAKEAKRFGLNTVVSAADCTTVTDALQKTGAGQ